ncbi:MAG: ABC transporter permease [Formosimonas sp.]|jgi:ABC-2 type transport system permease protein
MLWALIKKELIALSRDIHGLAALFIMPMMFIIIMSLALKNVYNPPVDTLNYAIEQLDTDTLANDFVNTWQDNHGTAKELPQNWQADIQSGRLDYVLVIEKNFSAQIIKDDVVDGTYLKLFAKPQIDVGVFNANKAALSAIATQMRAKALLKVSMAKEFTAPNTTKSSTDATVAFDDHIESERLSNGVQPTAVQQNVPAWLMFGMFFVVASIANLFIQERESGALTRLSSLGVPVSLMLLSKALPYLLVNAAQAALMLAVGVWLMPLLGGDALSLTGIDWPAFIFVIFSISAAAIGLALTLASLAKTHAQAAAIGPILNVLMAAIGGVMVPTFVMPDIMQRVSAYSPMNWGLNGMLSVLLNGQDIVGVWPHAMKLLAFAVFMFLLAMVLFKQRVK